MVIVYGYPLVICYIAIENCHLYNVFPVKALIFHSYVCLPEGRSTETRFSGLTMPSVHMKSCEVLLFDAMNISYLSTVKHLRITMISYPNDFGIL